MTMTLPAGALPADAGTFTANSFRSDLGAAAAAAAAPIPESLYDDLVEAVAEKVFTGYANAGWDDLTPREKQGWMRHSAPIVDTVIVKLASSML